MDALRDKFAQRPRSRSPGTETHLQSSRETTLKSEQSPESSSQSSFSKEHEIKSTHPHDIPPSIRRRISRAWTQKWQTAGENPEDARGSLGLRVLFSSPDPLIDLIFVHGLRGGSTKTWRKGIHPDLFWPQCWLPMEIGFENANIHSFGYDSDWGSTKASILNIHDFGQALYAEMRTSPVLRGRSSSPIILIGHSMGGLVIKKAFILAHQEKTDREIAGRVRCIIFLATPHHGSDYASVLNKILKVSGFMPSREYISDLTTGSTSLQLINEDFGRYADELPIYSFYETLPTSLGVSSSIIVGKTSAILGAGYKNERTNYLNANHRDICKFDSPEDSNYLTLRNALHAAVQDLLTDIILLRLQKTRTKLRTLQTYLGVAMAQDEECDKVEGSCEWIDDRNDFVQWRDSPRTLNVEYREYEPSIFWVTAGPGSGKTVLANHVARQFQQCRLECASYYFHYGKKASQSFAVALRSIAYQMASCNATVRDSLVAMYDEGSSFDLDDPRAIWTQVFRACIFQTHLFTPQYWVIDAIDECVTYSDFFTFLKGSRVQFPFRVFITSRKLADMPKLVLQVKGSANVSTFDIPVSETMKDIETYVQSRIGLLPIDNAEKKRNICQSLLQKSDGSFLWVRMVMDELEGVYGYESILEILNSIPEGMVPYYRRTIRDMSNNKREKHIAKAALKWAVIAMRPLSFNEISEGLKLDIGVHLSAKVAIDGLCGHFVSTDKKGETVRVVHDTAREFLFSEEAGEFSIRKSTSNETMALACLRLLSGPMMQPPRHPRHLGQKRLEKQVKQESPLLDYAIRHFSDHILGSSSGNDDLLVALDQFLRSTVTSWIRKVAEDNDMHCLIRTARNLSAFLERRAKHRSPLNVHVSNVDGWATDLSRLATKFGPALASSPAAIHFLIPPLCPSSSSIYKSFATTKAPDRLVLMGFQNDNWDDCVTTIGFNDEAAAAISTGNNLVAVGFESGNIHLYNHRSCQKERVIRHDFPIDLIHFDPLGSFVVASSRKFVSMWNLKGVLIWKTRVRSRCILLTSSSSFIPGLTQQGRLLKWHPQTGMLLEEQLFLHQSPDSIGGPELGQKAPFTATVSPGLELIALGYRNSPVCIFEFDSGELVGWAVDERNRGPAQLSFNPNPHVDLLLVAYNESHLALYDPWSGALVNQLESESRAVFVSVACSADGRTIATVDVLGSLRLLDFESLTILYHINIPMPSFRVLDFSSDSLTLVDVVDSEMRFWSPSALIRKAVDEEASTSDPASDLPVRQGQHQSGGSGKIRASVSHPILPIVFVGTQNGDVATYITETGERTGVLYSHADTPIRCLAVSCSDLVASCDVNGHLQVWKHMAQVTPSRTTVTCGGMQFQVHFSSPVRQLLFDTPGEHLLISTLDSDHLYAIGNGALVGSLDASIAHRSTWNWIALPTSAEGRGALGLLADHKFQFYSTQNFPAIATQFSIKLDYAVEDGFDEVGINRAVMNGKTLAIEAHQQSGFLSNSKLLVFQLPWTTQSTRDTEVTATAHSIGSKHFKHFIGFQGGGDKLVFLNGNSWVCSVDATSLYTNETSWSYTQHFFVPNELAGDTVSPIWTAEGDVVFSFDDKVAIVKNGMKFQETRYTTGESNPELGQE